MRAVKNVKIVPIVVAVWIDKIVTNVSIALV